MSLPVFGGFPLPINYTSTATADKIGLRFDTSYLQVYVRSAVATDTVRLYFTEKHATDDVHYVECTPSKPFDGPARIEFGVGELRSAPAIWIKATSGTPAVEIIAYVKSK